MARKRAETGAGGKFIGGTDLWSIPENMPLKSSLAPFPESVPTEKPAKKRLAPWRMTLVKCLGCEKLSGPDDGTDRYRKFMIPHFNTCKEKFELKLSNSNSRSVLLLELELDNLSSKVLVLRQMFEWVEVIE